MGALVHRRALGGIGKKGEGEKETGAGSVELHSAGRLRRRLGAAVWMLTKKGVLR